MDVQHPTVFISYSWDSEDHKKWVRELASRLVTNGVQVKLDQWDLAPGDSLTQFMEEHVERSDHVLVVCTPEYAARSKQRRGGVGYEQQVISGHIAIGVDRRKFIPILRRGEFEPGDLCAIPPQFSGIYAVDMRWDQAADEAFELLLRAIYREPLLSPPPLGAKPEFLRSGAGKDHAHQGAVRLPSLELDGWHLLSGLARNQKSPDTFEIPPEAQRREIQEGYIVKLIFETRVPNNDGLGNLLSERMWVRVTGTSGPYYTGTLGNVSLASDETDVLQYGAEVVFLPEHIIDIMDIEDQEEERKRLELEKKSRSGAKSGAKRKSARTKGKTH